MPTVIELKLKAERPVAADTRQLHGLACALFEGEGSAHLGQEKPFTVWPLFPSPHGGGPEWTLRTAWLPGGPPPASVTACAMIRLGSVTCAVTETAHRLVTHAQLASGPPANVGGLVFRSPAYFAQNGADTLIPDPRLILGSYRRRWNASLGDADALMISEETFREVHRATRLAAFELRTKCMDSGRGPTRAGFTGTVKLQLAPGVSSVARSVFSTLVRFAEFSGTGAQTTHGFGATEPVRPQPASGKVAAGSQHDG